MNIRDANILKTLNLLSLLKLERSAIFEDGDPKRDIFMVTEKHLSDSNLSKAEFIRVLILLAKRGYVASAPVFGDTFDSDIKLLYKNKEIQKEIEALDPNKELPQKADDALHKLVRAMTPANIEYEREDIESPSQKYVLEESFELLQDFKKGTFAFVLPIPFKDIDWLLSKMESGQSFDDIIDPRVHYDAKNYRLFFGDNISIETSYQNKPNKEHFALQALFKDHKQTEIDYIDIPEFDHSRDREREKKSFREALSRFLKKHPELPKIFTVRTDHLSLNEDYR